MTEPGTDRPTFFLPEETDLEALRSLDPERDWPLFKRGDRAWVLQTYLRLSRAGRSAELSDTVPRHGLVIFHSRHRKLVARRRRRTSEAILVGIRADNREPLIADYQVVQNGRFADGARRFFIPFWTQPGLIPRDPARGTRIARASFKGYDQSLHPDLRSAEWKAFLARHGIEWVQHSLRYRGLATDQVDSSWADFSDIDLIVALRPPDRRLHTDKPANKLFNAWLAGVPAVLGPEYAYREQRRSELDYIEVSSLAEARDAVERLCNDPERYRAMVDHGRNRAREFTADAIRARWERLLYETLPKQVAAGRGRFSRRLPLGARVATRRLTRLLTWRSAK